MRERNRFAGVTTIAIQLKHVTRTIFHCKIILLFLLLLLLLTIFYYELIIVRNSVNFNRKIMTKHTSADGGCFAATRLFARFV